MKFGVCDFSRFAVTDWRLRRWRLWCLAFMTATPLDSLKGSATIHFVIPSLAACRLHEVWSMRADLLATLEALFEKIVIAARLVCAPPKKNP